MCCGLQSNHQSLYVLGKHVDLEIDPIPDLHPSEIRACSVSGISDTEKPASRSSLTVRLTPSTATEPFSTK